jgi:hypothetical protein
MSGQDKDLPLDSYFLPDLLLFVKPRRTHILPLLIPAGAQLHVSDDTYQKMKEALILQAPEPAPDNLSQDAEFFKRETAWERRNPNQPFYAKLPKRRHRR